MRGTPTSPQGRHLDRSAHPTEGQALGRSATHLALPDPGAIHGSCQALNARLRAVRHRLRVTPAGLLVAKRPSRTRHCRCRQDAGGGLSPEPSGLSVNPGVVVYRIMPPAVGAGARRCSRAPDTSLPAAARGFICFKARSSESGHHGTGVGFQTYSRRRTSGSSDRIPGRPYFISGSKRLHLLGMGHAAAGAGAGPG